MTKQEALYELKNLVDGGFYFGVDQKTSITRDADNLLYRIRKLVEFDVYDVWESSENDWNEYSPVDLIFLDYEYFGVSSSDSRVLSKSSISLKDINFA